MSILIEDIEMPLNCEECGVKVVCKQYWKRIREQRTRPSWCPLVEIPPHGRLIDADAIDWVEGRDEQDRPVYLLLKMQIDDIPTIIEADEGEV